MRGPNTTYVPGIDHLRAFAATLIVAYHGVQLIGGRRMDPATAPSAWLHASNPFGALVIEGHTAVSLFMTLSGFIFTVAALDRQMRYSSFIKNRALRIFPLFIALLLVGVYGLAAKPDLTSIAASLLLLANIPSALQAAPFTSMFWTIAVEFQFYLIFPFLLAFLQRDGPSALFRIIAFLVVVRIAAVACGANARDLSYWTIVGRMDQFCIGMIFAWLYRSRAGRIPWSGVQLLLSFLSVTGLLYVLNIFGGWPTAAPWKVVFHTAEGALWGWVILCYLPVSERLPSPISSTLCFVGTISYSMYLLHFIVINLVLRQHLVLSFPSATAMTAGLTNTALIALPATLAVSALSYYAIELPFLNMRTTYLAELKK